MQCFDQNIRSSPVLLSSIHNRQVFHRPVGSTSIPQWGAFTITVNLDPLAIEFGAIQLFNQRLGGSLVVQISKSVILDPVRFKILDSEDIAFFHFTFPGKWQ